MATKNRLKLEGNQPYIHCIYECFLRVVVLLRGELHPRIRSSAASNMVSSRNLQDLASPIYPETLTSFDTAFEEKSANSIMLPLPYFSVWFCVQDNEPFAVCLYPQETVKILSTGEGDSLAFS